MHSFAKMMGPGPAFYLYCCCRCLACLCYPARSQAHQTHTRSSRQPMTIRIRKTCILHSTSTNKSMHSRRENRGCPGPCTHCRSAEGALVGAPWSPRCRGREGMPPAGQSTRRKSVIPREKIARGTTQRTGVHTIRVIKE